MGGHPGPGPGSGCGSRSGLYADTGETAELNLREGAQGGMGMHGLFIGTTGAGKSEGLITEIAAACLTHSPEVLNIVFTDFKLRSAAGAISRFPHVVAAVSNLSEERHLLGRLYDTLDGELDRRGEMLAALDDCPDVTTYNQRRLVDPSLPPIPALWVITDEYNEVFADPIWGPKFRQLYLRIARVGRSLQVFLKLVGHIGDFELADVGGQVPDEPPDEIDVVAKGSSGHGHHSALICAGGCINLQVNDRHEARPQDHALRATPGPQHDSSNSEDDDCSFDANHGIGIRGRNWANEKLRHNHQQQ